MGSPFWLITLVYDQDIKLAEMPEPSNKFLEETLDKIYGEVTGKSTKDFKRFIQLLTEKLKEYKEDVSESTLNTS